MFAGEEEEEEEREVMVLVVFLIQVRLPAAMPVCRTLLPVVDAAGIQVEKDKFRCEIEDYTITASNFWVVPTESLPSPLRDLARYREFVYDNGHGETDRGTLYPEDYILTTLSS